MNGTRWSGRGEEPGIVGGTEAPSEKTWPQSVDYIPGNCSQNLFPAQSEGKEDVILIFK